MKELKRAAIADCHYVIILTWLVPNAATLDTGIMHIVRIMEEFYPDVEFIVELIDEENIKYMNYGPNK